MTLPIASWKKTLKTLGYKIVRHSRKRKQKDVGQFYSYGPLEPRQLLAGDTGVIHVVDRGADRSFQYELDGQSIDSFQLQNVNNARGAATSPDGSTLYVINSNKRVSVFDTQTGDRLGTWRAERAGRVQGIATDGTNVWIVDAARDRVYFYENAADNLSGRQWPTSYFRLNNRQPTGITTDGENVWITDSRHDRVYVYDTDGHARGSWRLDWRNGRPTGISIDPAGSDGVWVLDDQDDRVYHYAQGRDHTNGYHAVTSSFALSSYNRWGQGIAVGPTTTVDQPSVPTISSISDDSGSSNADGITNDNTLLISGSADPGNTVTLTATTVGVLGTATVDNSGNWVIDATSMSLADGQFVLTATASDGTITSDPSLGFSLTIDTAAPMSLSITSIDEDTGALSTDSVTRDNTLVISGVTEPNSLVRLSEISLGQLGAVSAGSEGAWRIDLTDLVLADRIYSFTAIASDVAGNETDPTASFTVIVDTQSPALPVIARIDDDTGASADDRVTNDNTIIIRGTAEPNSVVTLSESTSGVLGTATTDAQGDWQFETTPLADGSYGFSVIAEDLAGNRSVASAVFDVVIDTSSPQTPTLDLDPAFDSPPIGDQTTSAPNVTVIGTTGPGAFVTLVETGQNAAANASGEFAFTNVSLTFGNNAFTVIAEDLAGNQSQFSQTVIRISDVPAPSIPTIISIDADTGISDSDGITNDTTLLIAGTSEPDLEVELSEVTLGVLGTTTADGNGDWNFELAGPVLIDGTYEFAAVAISPEGPRSDPSAPFSVIIDTDPPLRAVFDLDPSFDSGEIGDAYTTDSVVTLLGTTSPGAAVQLINSGATTTADGDGNFSFAGVQLSLGRHVYQIETSDVAGNSLISSKPLTFDQPIELTESGFVTEATRLVELGQNSGTRTVTFRVDADFGTNPTEFEDALLVYLVDPNDPSETLFDRGQPGTAVFSLIGDRAEFLPGLVRFDGSVVEIDVTDVDLFTTEGMLLFQLINNDSDSVTQISISEIGSYVDDTGVPSPVFAPTLETTPAAPIDVSGLAVSTGITVQYENIRYNSTTKRYSANIRVRNDGPDVGRTIVVTFDSLAADITFLNASGVDGNGDPYISMRNAIPTYGLMSGQSSDAVLVEFTAPTVSPFSVSPIVTDGGPNSAPVLDPIGTLNVMPGEVFRVDLSATDADGEGFYYRLGRAANLPNTMLTAEGQLVVAPSPNQIGTYSFEVVATDGVLSSSQPVTLNVVADPVTTTRISGLILDTNSLPLANIPVELGGTQTLTAADGSFELEFPGALPGDTLIVHGEAFAGPQVYPFIAEKMPLLLGHDAYDNVDNMIERPIYLPALDVANGVAIDPLVDVTVTTSSIPNASVFVAAGSLESQGGGPFTGDLSITQVPADFTPAALPPDLFPDLVVTIQPGEMVFTTPAPLNLPNLAGYLPGTEMTLWSINPNTGLFDDVGVGVVSADGSTVETVSGGINNSSWHFFSPGGPNAKDPKSNPRNQDKECEDCEETDLPNDDHEPNENNNEPEDIESDLNAEFMEKLIESVFNDLKNNPSPTSGGGGRPGGVDGGWGSGGTASLGSKADFGPYGSWDFSGGKGKATFQVGRNNVTPPNNPLLQGNDWNANDTEVALHSGAVNKSHDLAPYQSLGVWHGLQLSYDSERADARPIVSTGFNNIQNNLTDPTLATKLSLTRGNVTLEVPGFIGTQSGLTGGEHFFSFPTGATSLDVAIQADMRSMPTGVYEFASTSRFAGNRSGSFTGTATTTSDRLVHVNTINSPFGSGWGLSGLTEIVENPDGSLLLVDGSGGELAFMPPANVGEAYVSPPGDFTTLVKLGSGLFQRTHVDQTVEDFSATNKLARITDRNGNETQFLYNVDDNLEFIVDAVGLVTTLRYTNGNVTEIEDPAGRITVFSYQNGDLVGIQDPDNSARQFTYDSVHRLTGETDKLGSTERIQYQFSGRIEKITRKDGSTIQYSPVQTQGLYRPEQTNNLSALVPAQDLGERALAEKVDANGNVTRIELDKQGQLVDPNDAEGDLPEVGRNSENLVERIVDGRGNLTIINYDSRGNVISISDPISRGASGGTSSGPLFANPAYGVDTYAFQIVSADFNNDGFTDIVAENGFGGDSVSVLLNNRVGGFVGRTDYGAANSTGVVAADVNNDGNVDIVTSNQNDVVSVLLGNGDGTLQAALTYATGDNPEWIEAADLNDDGFVDLVTADANAGTVSVLLGNGTGQFNSFTSFTVASTPQYLAIGDLNNDDVLDIVAANNQTTDGLSILSGVGDGTFEASTFITTSDSATYVVLGDVTGDDNLDIVTGNRDLLVLPGLGDGSFGPGQVITRTTSTLNRSALVDGDFDGDLDLVFTEVGNDIISVYENDGSGNFVVAQIIATPDGPFSTLGADIDLDGIVDLVTLSANTDTLVPYRGVGDGTFVGSNSTEPTSIAVGDVPTSIEVADFNNDGHEDVVVGAQFDSSITIMLGAGDGTLMPLSPIAAGGLVTSLASADLDADGFFDLVSTHFTNNELQIRYGDGAGGFGAPLLIAMPAGPREVQIADVNNDGFLDIVAVGYNGAAEPWHSNILGNGDQTFASPLNVSARFEASTIDVGDINGDGNLDLVVGVSYFSSGNAARPYFGQGDGTYVDQGNIPFGGGAFAGPPQQLKLVDIDDDGNLDIVGLDVPTNSLGIFISNGNGSFQPVVRYQMDAAPRHLDVGDIDGDGILDIIVSNSGSDRASVFLGQNNGTLGLRQDFAVGDGPYGIVLVDLNEDGSLDFVTTNSEADTISIHLNSTDFANQSAQVYEYDPTFSQVTRSVDEEGRQIIYDIDAVNGNTLSMTEVIGDLGGGDDIVTSFAYTSAGQIDTITDPLGRVTDMDYNARGLLEKVTFAVGTGDEAFVMYEYDLAGNQTTVIDGLGHRTDYVYDELNRITQVTEADPDGIGPLASPVTTHVYDGHGNLISATDALNHTTQFVYDEQHRLVETIDANLQSIWHEYDESGNLTATTDRLGRRTQYNFDERNRLIETVNAEGGRAQKFYDEDNNVVATVDENGVTTRYAFDSRNRLIQSTNALDGTVRYEYDGVDNITAITDELGRRTEMMYDELNRVTTTTMPDPDKTGPEIAPVTTYVYDDASNLVSTTDALGNTTAYAYDQRDRLVQQTDPDPDGAGPLISPVWVFEYDDANRLIRATDPLDRESSFVYDDLNRTVMKALPDPDGIGPNSFPVTTFTYDAVGNRTTIIDALGNTTDFEYDDLYRVVSTTAADPDGAGPLPSSVTTFDYDVEGQIVRVIDPLGRTTTIEYDDLGRVVTETLPDPDGAGPDASPVFTYAYDGVGNQVSMTDALGNVTHRIYDDLYRLVKFINEDPDGAGGSETNPETIFRFDPAHQLVVATDPLGRTTQFEYDDLGRVVRETYPDPDGTGADASPVMTYVYDLMNNQLSMTDALGNVTEYAYDDLYRIVATIEADPDGAGPETNPVTTFAYDVASQLVSMTDALGRVTVMEYDALGRVVRQTEPDPDGAGPSAEPVMTYAFDLMNNQLSMTDALGNLTQYQYDNLYRTIRVIQADPDGAGPQNNPTTAFGYDLASQLTSITDPLGRATSYDYDNLGRVVREIYPDPDGAGPLAAPEMTYVYDLMNNELSMTDAVGNLTQYEYDNLYRLTQMVEADPDGAGPLENPVTQYTYDIASQLLVTTDPLIRTTTNEFDKLGRVVRTTQPDPDGAGPLSAPEMSYAYDLMNNQLSMTDPLGHVTHYVYDSLYRVVREIGEDLDGAGPLTNPTTEYAYDRVDNLLSLTDSSGNRTDYTYDDLDRLFAETIELGTGNFETRTFEYDLEDNLVRRTDRNGRVTEFEYDEIYRLVEERWVDETAAVVNTLQFEFDEASQMLRAEDLTIGSRYDYTYDDLSRVTQTLVDNGGAAIVFANAYDAQSRRTERTASVGGVADYRNVYAYDGLNRLSRLDQVAQAGGATVADKRIDMGYNADDQLTLISRYKDVAGGASDLVLQSAYGYDGIGRLDDLVHAGSTATIVDYDWAYDAASRITEFTNSVDGVSEFDYDNGNQLTDATHAVQADEAYEYDEDGNRTNAGYSTGFYNRLTSDGTFDYEYDAEGNRTKRTNIATGEVTEYDWDHRNRLVSVTDRTTDGGPATQTVEHRYDAFNRWISKTVDADGDGSSAPETTRYEYDGNQIVLELDDAGSITHRYVWGPGVDQILADEHVGDQVYWTAGDHQGTVRDVVDSNGNVANHIVYDSFGNVVSETNLSAERLFGYTGRAFDESTGLQNNLNRWYEATTGRWVSEDPISFRAGDANLYRYVENSSLNYIDPFGFDVYRDARNSAAMTKGFAQGVGVGVGNWAQGVVGTAQGAADYFNYVRFGAFAGGARIVEAGWTFVGGSEFTIDDNALAIARDIGGSSKAIKGVDTALQLMRGMNARELAGLAGSIADALGDAAKDWFERYNKNIENGCYEQAGRMLGKLVGEILPDIAAGLGARSASKLGRQGLKDAIIKFLKEERGTLNLDKMLGASARGAFRSIDDFAAGRNFPNAVVKQKAWEVYRRAASSNGIVIGFGDDVVRHGTKDGFDLLSFSENALGVKGDEWWPINKAWLDGAIDSGIPVKLVSRGDDVAEALELAMRTGKERGLTREIRYLMMKVHPFTLDP